MYYIDPMYFYFALPGLILGLIAQFLISIRYNKYSKIPAESHMTGLDAAELIRDREDFPIDIATNQGKLQDNFDPRKDIVNISSDNINSNSVANIAVVAHEFGHVDQKFSGSSLFKFRNAIVPVVNIGSSLGISLIFIGLLIDLAGLANIGLILFSATTLFAFITIPIERDATKRGLKFIEEYDLVPKEKLRNAKSVLNAASMTYVAGLISSIANLLYYSSLVKRKN